MNTNLNITRPKLANPWVYFAATFAWTCAFWGIAIAIGGNMEEAGAGMALPADPSAWRAALMGLAFQRERVASMAAAGQALASKINDAEAQRTLWAELLEI